MARIVALLCLAGLLPALGEGRSKGRIVTTIASGGTRLTPSVNTTGNPAAPQCACGKHNKDASRIVNGTETNPHEYPFFAALYEHEWFFCGGSLISDKWVLTAAHCVGGTAVDILRVRLGGHDRTQQENSSRTYKVNRVIIHENYDPTYYDSDIALLELKKSVEISSNISPVCLPTSHLTEESFGKMGIVMGYGVTVPGGWSLTNVLHDVQLQILSKQQCEKINYAVGSWVSELFFCAYTLHKDSCQGDSGGPLVYEKNNTLFQIGIVSGGYGCARRGWPAEYARVETFNGWIDAKTNNTICRF